VTCDNSPVSDKQVSLKADVVARSSGHEHDDAARHLAYNGQVAFTGTTGEITDSDGYVYFTFTAPSVAGDHTITAECVDHRCGTDSGKIWVGIKGLISIPASSVYEIISPNADIKHPDNHYLTVVANARLAVLATLYHAKFPNNPILHLNDASLERGGLFDCCASHTDQAGTIHYRAAEGWWTTPHLEHRRGTVIDIRKSDTNGGVPADALHDLWFKTFVSTVGGSIWPEGDHYHVRLTGVAE